MQVGHDSRLDGFRSLVRDLVVRDGIRRSALLDALRDALEAAACGMPKVDVAFCRCYGAYGYSKAFRRFLDAQGVAHDLRSRSASAHRTGVVRHIASFGAQCAELYPGVAQTVRAYLRHDLGGAFHMVVALAAARLKRTRARARAAVNAADPLAAADDAASANEGEGEGRARWALAARFGAGAVEIMLRATPAPAPSDADADADADGSGARKKVLCFSEAVEAGSASAWEHQSHMNRHAVRFLLVHGESHLLAGQQQQQEREEAGAQLEPRVQLQLGLLFASSACCRLAVAKMPGAMDWQITDQDGWEEVSFA